MAKLMSQLEQRAQLHPKTVVFPEGESTEILEAAAMLVQKGAAKPILIGRCGEIERNAAARGLSLEGISIKGLPDEDEAGRLADDYLDAGGMLSRKGAVRRMKDPLYYAAILTRLDRADAMVAGLNYATSEVILASSTIIGMEEGISTPSSICLMEVPGFSGPEREYMIFADPAVCEKPGAAELADIALSSARTARLLMEWEPRVALLSFSTKGSVQSELVDLQLDALEEIRSRDGSLLVDGELQLDAAIVPQVAKKKVPGGSDVAGRANVLVFPDLNAGNICYKAVQRFASGNAYGPILQGFSKSVSDLSRGSSVDDIVGAAIIASLCA